MALSENEPREITGRKFLKISLAANLIVIDSCTFFKYFLPMSKLKFGFDLHGVLDKYPELRNLANKLAEAGHEVHVITGSHWRRELEDYIRWELGVNFTHFFSIADYHREKGTPMWYEGDNPFMGPEHWNPTKGEYCKREGIFLHFDDSEKYGEHFEKTIYALWRR